MIISMKKANIGKHISVTYVAWLGKVFPRTEWTRLDAAATKTITTMPPDILEQHPIMMK